MQGVNGNLFNVGKSALYAFQQGISVAGHNIANVNTPGYSRQRLVLGTNASYSSPIGILSSGVTTVRVESIRDAYINARILLETQDLGKWDAMKQALTRLESVFSESSSYGLNTLMSQFWNGWQEVANTPMGYAERMVLIGNGAALTHQLRRMWEDMANIRRDLDAQIKMSVATVNRLTHEVAELNGKIGIFEKSGHEANDLRDSREQALIELSDLIDINVVEDEEGMVSVMLSNGKPLVSKGVSWNIAVGSGGDGLTHLFWHDPSAPANDISGSIHSGQLNGLIQARDVVIPQYMQYLDDLAIGVIDQVNGLHQAGEDLHGNAGLPFFSGSGAATIAMNVQQPELIAAAEAGGGAGDNRNAIAIASLADQLTMTGNTTTFSAFLATLVAGVGDQSLQAQRNHGYRNDMVLQMENYRESISGVSLDEEMINLIQYQHAYHSAAKLISISDEMLQTLLDII